MKFIKTKRGYVLLLATLVVAGAAAFGAYAYFTSAGSGSASATGGSSKALKIDLDGTITGLTPNGPLVAVPYTISNPNGTGDELVNTVTTSVDPNFDFSDGVSGDPDCTAADFTVAFPTQTVNKTISGGGSYDFTVIAGNATTIQLTENGLDQDACQGVTVPLLFTSN